MEINSFSVSILETCTLPCGSLSINNCDLINAGKDLNTLEFSLDKEFSMIAIFSVSVPFEYLLSFSNEGMMSFKFAIIDFNSGTNSIKPSGITAIPKFLPFSERLTTMSVI